MKLKKRSFILCLDSFQSQHTLAEERFYIVYGPGHGSEPYLVSILHVPTDLSNMFWKLLLDDALVSGWNWPDMAGIRLGDDGWAGAGLAALVCYVEGVLGLSQALSL